MKHPIDKRIYEANSVLFSLTSDQARPSGASSRPASRRIPRIAAAAAAAVVLTVGMLLFFRGGRVDGKNAVSLSAPYAARETEQPVSTEIPARTVSLQKLQVEPRWLPEGYAVTDQNTSREALELFARNEGDEYIRIRVLPAADAEVPDAPEGTAVTVQGCDAVLTTGETGAEVSWVVPELELWVDALGSALDGDDLLRVAENLDIREIEDLLEEMAGNEEAQEESESADPTAWPEYEHQTEDTGWRVFMKYPDEWCKMRWMLEVGYIKNVPEDNDPLTWESFREVDPPCSEDYYQQWLAENGHYYGVVYGFETISPEDGEDFYYQIHGFPRTPQAYGEFVDLFGHEPDESLNPWAPGGLYYHEPTPAPEDLAPVPAPENPEPAAAPDDAPAGSDPASALFEQYLQTGVPSSQSRSFYHTEEEGDVLLTWEEIRYYELYGALPASYYDSQG